MSEVDPMEYLRLETDYNVLNSKHNDLRQASKLLCESINDNYENCPTEVLLYFNRVKELLEN